ncbi:hypothetical protein LIPSTDRAFT_69536 [Lipomyces starkeyi NRRL Y-11557]|uniref:Uncharacterized protein n=1 Tax=Lipomyces starkeyi NRRL Y-11557 TaxID=675824 RepID=A0A1E3QCA0_LIPST|nr:hypothetical protein LIPSTDRAFT_69536 [Lipomyces starkeyi NRRL Y-11557]
MAATQTGFVSQGKLRKSIRVHEYSFFKVPDNVESSLAVPMLVLRQNFMPDDVFGTPNLGPSLRRLYLIIFLLP